MLRRLLNWTLCQIARRGSVRGPHRIRDDGPNAQFINYLAETGARQVNADHYETSLRHRRLGKALLLWMLGAGCAWVIIESARAISMF